MLFKVLYATTLEAVYDSWTRVRCIILVYMIWLNYSTFWFDMFISLFNKLVLQNQQNILITSFSPSILRSVYSADKIFITQQSTFSPYFYFFGLKNVDGSVYPPDYLLPRIHLVIPTAGKSTLAGVWSIDKTKECVIFKSVVDEKLSVIFIRENQ